ncbi:MAG: AMP-binding protein [Tateyamaria sp.]|uniref:AMP-binding protein n=1 Tax=Tateyamaria sp. TaxID=1929288 RepID=UPI0032733D87
MVGPSTPELMPITIPQMMQNTVAQYGENLAIVSSHQDIRRSYDELDREVLQLAAGFLSLGLEKGDRVGIWAPNCYEWVLTQLATARIGLILVNINPAYRTAEAQYALNKSGCKALVAAERFKTSHYIDMIRALAPELDSSEPAALRSETLPHLQQVIAISQNLMNGVLRFSDVQKAGAADHERKVEVLASALSCDDAINIQFTSGTTGAPKGATLTHFNIVNNAQFVTDRIVLGPTDKLCIPVPLYHCFGMVMGVLGALSKGAAILLPSEGFDTESTLDCLEQEKCTALYGVPTMFVTMLESLKDAPRDLASLRTGIMAGAPCPVEVMQRVGSEMNMTEVTICYGMTETSPVSFQSFVDDPLQLRCETVGRVHPHLEVKIVDEVGAIVPVGAQGELCTRGYSVMKGYWEDDVQTADCIQDGWMQTGDLATLDENGFCRITGRVKDMIIRGGENIYPREIEEFLFTHPKVSQAQIFGIPDEKFGEIVCAWVVQAPGTELRPKEILNYCEGQIARHKVPAHVRVVSEIPMTVTGKPQKFIMRDQMLKQLAHSAAQDD